MRPSQFKTFNIHCSTWLTGDVWFLTAYFYDYESAFSHEFPYSIVSIQQE